MKDLYILRATSNSGKSTLANELAFRFRLFGKTFSYPICCADDYFTDKKGNYNFNVNKLGFAHNQCQTKCEIAMIKNNKKIIVANTNTTEKEVNTYRNLAEQYGYRVFIIVVEKWHNNTNNHSVPDEVIRRQEQNILNSIKLSNLPKQIEEKDNLEKLIKKQDFRYSI